MSDTYYNDECIGCGRLQWVCDLKHAAKDILGGIAIGFIIGGTIGAVWAFIHNTFFSIV